MRATERLHEQGQSLWLDNITRSMLDEGTIEHYIKDYSVTGLTSNPSIFDKAIGSGDYDDAIRTKAAAGLSGEDLFFDLAVEDLRRAADLFAPIHQRTDAVDGWVSLEVSPLLAYDTTQTVEAAKALHTKAGRPNLFIKIPGTPEGLPAITEAIAAGVPVNVTLLFSADHYRAAAGAYLDGVERRVAQGLDPRSGRWRQCSCRAGTSRWRPRSPPTWRTSWVLPWVSTCTVPTEKLMRSDRVQRLENEGARMQRLLWASTKTKDPAASDTLYVHGLAAPFTREHHA